MDNIKKFRTTFEKITWARKLLGLSEFATAQEIRDNFRKLIAKWHPDKCREEEKKCEEMTEMIISANQIIKNYCEQYKFSFCEEEVKKYISKEEWWFDRFGVDPLWGPGEGTLKKT